MSSKAGMTSMCMGCASMIDQKPKGRWRDYCSGACRQRAYRSRVTKPSRPTAFRNGEKVSS